MIGCEVVRIRETRSISKSLVVLADLLWMIMTDDLRAEAQVCINVT